MKKRKFGKGRIVYASDHNTAQDYMEDNIQLFAQDAGFNGGVISGLAVSADSPVSWNVKVAVGAGRDPYGDRMPVTSIQTVDVEPTDPGSGNEVYVSVFMKYAYTNSSPDTDEDGVSYYKDYADGFTITATEGTAAPLGTATPPAIPADSICLADVLVTKAVYTRGNIQAGDILTSRRVTFSFMTESDVDAYFDTASTDNEIVRFSGTDGQKLQRTPTTPPTISDAGILTINNATDSTTKDTGALIVEGGVGVEKSIVCGGRAKDATGYIAPVGAITMFGGSTAPDGWLLCDGSSLARTGTYADLFAVIGTTFGAADGSHFSLPDMRGVFAKGAGTTDRVAGVDASGNAYAATLGSYSQDQMLGHYHDGRRNTGGGGANVAMDSAAVSNVTTFSVDTTLFDVAAPKDDGTNGTPRTGHTTEPQSLGLNYIIKY